MSKPTPDIVAHWIEKDCSQTVFQPVRDIISLTLRDRLPRYSEEQIAELAEEIEPDVITSLQNQVSEYREEGIKAPFEISDEEGAAYFRTLPSPETDLLREMRKMLPDGFEIFCTKILNKLKADAVVEGGPYDGGVDFYALGLSWGKLVEPAPPSSKAVVIGQSKRYSEGNDVGESDIRSFIGGAVKRTDELRRRHPDRFGILTPVLLAFWITSDFSISAKKYARELGLWYLNGVGLAQLAARLGLTCEDLKVADAEAECRRQCK